jgi:hypothetical protein
MLLTPKPCIMIDHPSRPDGRSRDRAVDMHGLLSCSWPRKERSAPSGSERIRLAELDHEAARTKSGSRGRRLPSISRAYIRPFCLQTVEQAMTLIATLQLAMSQTANKHPAARRCAQEFRAGGTRSAIGTPTSAGGSTSGSQLCRHAKQVEAMFHGRWRFAALSPRRRCRLKRYSRWRS